MSHRVGDYVRALIDQATGKIRGFRTPADEDQLIVDAQDLAASTGSALVGHIASGTGAVARTLQSKALDIVSMFDYFTDAQRADVSAKTKSISVATAMAACLTAVQAAGGGAVWMPPGGYLAPTISTADGQSYRIIGSGNQNTTIWTNSATASVLDLIAWNSSIEHVGFDSTVTRTAGNYVTLTGAYTKADNCQFNNDFTGVYMVGVNAKVLHCIFRTGASGGSRIVAGGGDTTQLIHGCLIGAQSAPYPLCGIRVQDSSALTISDTSVIAQGVDLLIDPGAGQTVYSLKVHDCFFDTAGTGVLIQPAAGGGSVQRVDFVDCWTCSMTGSGFQIIQAGTASVTGVRLVNHQGHLNAGSGVDVSAASTTLLADFNVLGGAFAQNTSYGIAIGNNVCGFSIMGARCGAADGLTGNSQRGIIVFGTNHDNYSITGNFLLGNTVGAMLDQGTGTTKIVRHNLGYNPIAPAAVSVGASPYTYTNTTGDTAVLAIYGGTVSSVTLNGRTVATATNTAVTVPHGRSVVITHSSTPSAEVMGF
jgi:hypothetical protein